MKLEFEISFFFPDSQPKYVRRLSGYRESRLLGATDTNFDFLPTHPMISEAYIRLVFFKKTKSIFI